MREPPVRRFPGGDGVALAYRELGEGRPLVLLHGFFSLATHSWLRPGHAAALAGCGHRVIMPDLRGHGHSARPHDVSSYPRDVLADDGFALIDHLGLTEYDLGGYSLGGRIVVRMMVRGAGPGRAIVAGQGLSQITGAASGGVATLVRRTFAALGSWPPGSPEWRAERWLRSISGDPVALLLVLDTLVATRVEALAGIAVPTLVVTGADDDRGGDGSALARTLQHGWHVAVPGDHAAAVAAPELAATIISFLDAQ